MSASEFNPQVLTFRFHQFRPSDRVALTAMLGKSEGESAFISALGIYLRKWAEGSWLTEYDLERVAEWTARHHPAVARKLVAAWKVEHEAAQLEQAKQTYAIVIKAAEGILRASRGGPSGGNLSAGNGIAAGATHG